MPDTTLPKIVYLPSSAGAVPNMMKNWLSALFGSEARAIATTPRTKCSLVENSACSGCPEPPVPVPVGSPPCAMNHHAIIKPGARQLLDLRAGIGRQIGAQLDHHAAESEIHVEEIFWIGLG